MFSLFNNTLQGQPSTINWQLSNDSLGKHILEDRSSKKRVLFIPASIRSHIIPTLYVADRLAKEYEVFYAVTSPLLADIVVKNGYTPIINDLFRIGVGMEQNFLRSRKREASFIQVLKAIWTNELFWYRKQVLDNIITQLKPDTIVIDIFNSSDFLALYSYRSTVQLIFCNPMLSTYRVKNYPIVSEVSWHSPSYKSNKSQGFNLKRFIKSPRTELYNSVLRHQWQVLQRITNLASKYKPVDTAFTKIFKNIPELVLAPLEFELSPEVRGPNQYYLGLCIREQRIDLEIDFDFAKQWPCIQSNQQAGKRIIYCSFGTFYTGSDRVLLNFITTLLSVISTIENVQLICSVNSLVLETLRARQVTSPNVHYFKRVPQLEVLQSTSIHITHGGLGSIKESIHYCVPMLVYPLDLQYDQNGNGLKVEYHGLGLRGVFGQDDKRIMGQKVNELLTNTLYKTNLSKFKNKIKTEFNTSLFKLPVL